MWLRVFDGRCPLIDVRASLLPTDRVVDSAAIDRYSYLRSAYLQQRRS